MPSTTQIGDSIFNTALRGIYKLLQEKKSTKLDLSDKINDCYIYPVEVFTLCITDVGDDIYKFEIETSMDGDTCTGMFFIDSLEDPATELSLYFEDIEYDLQPKSDMLDSVLKYLMDAFYVWKSQEDENYFILPEFS